MSENELAANYYYELPSGLIAQNPASNRDDSRLMVLNSASATVEHRTFREIHRYLKFGDIVIFNNVKVVPARFFAKRVTGGTVEILILEGWSKNELKVLLKPARRIFEGEELILEDGHKILVKRRNDQSFQVVFQGKLDLIRYLERHGEMPTPPYIQRFTDDPRKEMDRERYQTIFAKIPGAVAAPTAGLHFTQDLMNTLKKNGVTVAWITLHVGWGTFKPIKVKQISEHKMDGESYSIPAETALCIKDAKKHNRRVIAIGTTTTRALESWANDYPNLEPVNEGKAELFIVPGYKFKIIQGIVTNFHLPESTLMMLVSAFAGRETILSAYRVAVEQHYRFYSYGDAMFII